MSFVSLWNGNPPGQGLMNNLLDKSICILKIISRVQYREPRKHLVPVTDLCGPKFCATKLNVCLPYKPKFCSYTWV